MYSAKEAAEITGLSTAALRYYLQSALVLTQSKFAFYENFLKEPMH